MEGNDDKARFGWMAEETMRAGRVVQIKTRPEQRPNNISGRASGQAGHEFLDRYFDALHVGGAGFNRDLFTMLHETLDVTPDGVLHHRPGLFDGVSLCNEPREGGNRHDKSALDSGLENGRVVILRHAVTSSP